MTILGQNNKYHRIKKDSRDKREDPAWYPRVPRLLKGTLISVKVVRTRVPLSEDPIAANRIQLIQTRPNRRETSGATHLRSHGRDVVVPLRQLWWPDERPIFIVWRGLPWRSMFPFWQRPQRFSPFCFAFALLFPSLCKAIKPGVGIEVRYLFC